MRAIVVHGGAGGTDPSPQREEGCRLAGEVALSVLANHGSALDAAVSAVVWMENDGRFNAGRGAIRRLNGRVLMDAVIATSDEVIRTAEFVSGVLNPVLLAKELLNSPMHRIGGAYASQFARERGLRPHPGSPPHVIGRWEAMRAEAQEMLLRGEIPEGWEKEEIERALGMDTVGALALDEEGNLALASSTGGSGMMHPARGGDVPVRGAGFQISHSVAVLATGVGEEILQWRGSEIVATMVLHSEDPQKVCEDVASDFSKDVGFICLTVEGKVGVGANCDMPSWHAIVE